MKYIPLFGEEAKHRHYIGKFWNRKYIRAIQSILNVTKGIVASGREFFEKAFGKDISEFFEILYMPETYIIYRKIFEESGLTDIWRQDFYNMKDSGNWEETKRIIEESDFTNLESKTNKPDILSFLNHYIIKHDDIVKQDHDVKYTRKKFNELIKEDRFVNLTLTYDFE